MIGSLSLPAAVRAALRAPTAVVLIDGRSGAGKSVLAAALARDAGARLLRLDDVYPGWDGLDTGADAVVRQVLVPRRRGVAGAVRTWDWAASRQGEPVVVPVDGPLVVEGCGAIRPASAALADLTVWLDLDAASRRHRAVARDGDAYLPFWDRWARQEALAIARDDPAGLADLRVDAR